MTHPSIVLLDEPTSGLDSDNAFDLAAVTRMLAHAGRTVVSVVH